MWRPAGLGLAALAMGLTGCGSGQASPPTAGGTGEELHYAVAWQVGADAYDEQVAEAALSKCDQVPGTERGAQPDSLPPVPQWVFTGSDQQRAEFEDCLLNLDQAVIYGPRRDGEGRSPVLKR